MKRLLILFLILMTAIGAGIYGSTTSTPSSISFGDFSFYKPEVLGIEKNTISDKRTIEFVGDVMLARNVENIMDTYGSFYPFSQLPKLSEDAYLVGNFESAIPKIHTRTPSMQFSFSVNPLHIAGMSEYGFTHLGLANNHSYDYGKDDFKNTISVLQTSGFETFGTPVGMSSTSISFLQVGSSTVALVGVYAVNTSPIIDEVISTFKSASQSSDIQIAYVHWGTEYALVHNETQEKLAQTLIDAGADMVVGHHPHVVQDIDIYKNRIIFYSLGNFVFDQYFSEDVGEGLMLSVSIQDTNLVTELLPITTKSSRVTPRLMPQFEKDVFLKKIAKNSDTELQEMILSGNVLMSLQ
jgi:poly-gamma-glutamate synthesis protein (capsule biosynthesis protein)